MDLTQAFKKLLQCFSFLPQNPWMDFRFRVYCEEYYNEN